MYAQRYDYDTDASDNCKDNIDILCYSFQKSIPMYFFYVFHIDFKTITADGLGRDGNSLSKIAFLPNTSTIKHI